MTTDAEKRLLETMAGFRRAVWPVVRKSPKAKVLKGELLRLCPRLKREAK